MQYALQEGMNENVLRGSSTPTASKPMHPVRTVRGESFVHRMYQQRQLTVRVFSDKHVSKLPRVPGVKLFESRVCSGRKVVHDRQVLRP